jgi:hypothetical protein
VTEFVPAYTPFSIRNSFDRAAPITIIESAPIELRLFLQKALNRYLGSATGIRNFVFSTLMMLPPNTPSATDVSLLLMNTDWFHVYDLIEALHDEMGGFSPNQAEFAALTNAFFERKGYAYKLTSDSHIEHRGDEAFDAAVRNADMSLADAGSTTARAEIHKALEDLAKRPVADLSGAVQHAMAGLECIANQAAGSCGLELGKVIKSRPDLFPPPLNEVVPKLYGYASNNGRHITEGGEPDFAEAELLVGTAAIVATYLARKLK